MSTLFGDNGIINYAKRAQEETKRSTYQDVLDTLEVGLQVQRIKDNLTKEEYFNKFKEAIRKEPIFEGSTITDIEPNGEDGFIVETPEHFRFRITEEGVTDIGKEGDIPKPPTELQDGDIKIIQDITTPTKKDVTVTIENNVEGKFYLQYVVRIGEEAEEGTSIEETEWQAYKDPIIMDKNGVIYARLVNELKEGGSYATGNVTNIDKEKPTEITFSSASSTTNSIKITATAKDAVKTATNACSGIKELHFWYSDNGGTSEEDWKSEIIKTNEKGPYEESGTYTETAEWTKLTQGKKYTVKVKAIDYAENEKEIIYDQDITTGKVPDGGDGLQGSKIEFNCTPVATQWAQSRVVKLINNAGNQYSMEYSFTANNDWKPYTGEIATTGITMTSNVPLYARLTDSTGQPGGSATYNEQKIDRNPPQGAQIEVAESMTTAQSIIATVTQADNANESGIDYANSKWVFNTTSGVLGTTDSDLSKYSGGNFGTNEKPTTQIALHSNTAGDYYLHVLSVDIAGNRKETVKGPIKVIPLATNISLNKTETKIDLGKNETLTATIEPAEARYQTIKWESSVPSVATVDNGTVTALTKGRTQITAKTTDGSNKSATCNVTVQDPKIAMLGGYVDFGLDLNGKNGTKDDWRVFYIGGITEDDPEETKGRIYIIAADYIPNTNATMQEVLSKNVIEKYTKEGESWHTYYWSSSSKIPAFNYTDTSTAGQNIFPELFMGTGYYCSKHTKNPNAEAVGVLQNTENWQPFIAKSTFADKAIGGPTLEMCVKSWNAKHGNDSSDASKKELYFKGEDKNNPGTATGYYVGDSPAPTSKYINVNTSTGYNDTLYFPHTTYQNLKLDNEGENDDTCYGYWLASPSAGSKNSLMCVGYGSIVSYNGYNSSGEGLRALVSLKSGVQLEDSGSTVADPAGNQVKLYNITN